MLYRSDTDLSLNIVRYLNLLALMMQNDYRQTKQSNNQKPNIRMDKCCIYEIPLRLIVRPQLRGELLSEFMIKTNII